LRQSRGEGYWRSSKDGQSRHKPGKDVAAGLAVGDVVYSFDPDDLKFEQAVVAHVDCSGVAYRVWDDGDESVPLLCVVWSSWAKTKRDALLSVSADIKAELEAMLAELS
jgi:hypothetical protein